MIKREAEHYLLKLASQFRAVAVVGPRQSGKSTLVKALFKDKPYVSLENPDTLLFATSDPRGFLANYPKGAILDEVQRVTPIFNYLQEILDNSDEDGLFILTGSNNFLLQEKISQSLAGRIGYLDLLPFSFGEYSKFNNSKISLNYFIKKGSYPEIYHKKRDENIWYANYIRTFVERDVRQILNISNSNLFTKFLKICAGRVGQLLNVTAISNECGIDQKTTNAWLSILQQSFIIYLLPPYFNSFNKRITKTPKLYFIDSGLACTLLNIKTDEELQYSHFRESLVENQVVMELLKQNYNHGIQAEFSFWRENNGVEIDLIIEKGSETIPIEIKSSQTFKKDFIKNLTKFKKYSGITKNYVLYDGKSEFLWLEETQVLNWKNFHLIEL